MTTQLDFAVIRKAKLTQLEFSEVAGVSRVQISRWITGKSEIHALRLGKITKLLKIIQSALDDQLLPLQTTDPVKRKAQFREVLLQYIKAN